MDFKIIDFWARLRDLILINMDFNPFLFPKLLILLPKTDPIYCSSHSQVKASHSSQVLNHCSSTPCLSHIYLAVLSQPSISSLWCLNICFLWIVVVVSSCSKEQLLGWDQIDPSWTSLVFQDNNQCHLWFVCEFYPWIFSPND